MWIAEAVEKERSVKVRYRFGSKQLKPVVPAWLKHPPKIADDDILIRATTNAAIKEGLRRDLEQKTAKLVPSHTGQWSKFWPGQPK